MHKSGCTGLELIKHTVMAQTRCSADVLEGHLAACEALYEAQGGDHWGSGLMAVFELYLAYLTAFSGGAETITSRNTPVAGACTGGDCPAEHADDGGAAPAGSIGAARLTLEAATDEDEDDWALPAFLGMSHRFELDDAQFWAGKNGSYAGDPSSAPEPIVLSAIYLQLSVERLSRDFANQGRFALSAPHAQLIDSGMMKEIFVEGALMVMMLGDWDAWNEMNIAAAKVGVFPSRCLYRRPAFAGIA